MKTKYYNTGLTHWNHPLQADERILWQGAPLPGVRNIPIRLLKTLLGVVLLFWGAAMLSELIFEAARRGPTFNMVLFFFIGVTLLFTGLGYCFFDWRDAARAHLTKRYALSNHCAYIAQHDFRASLKCYPILPETAVELDHRKGYDNLWLHLRKEEDSDRHVTTTKIGFEGIADGAKVLALIRKVQLEQTKRAEHTISHSFNDAKVKAHETTHPDLWS